MTRTDPVAAVSHDDWARVKDIVAGALIRRDADRGAYVAARCGDDQGLREDVESLVAAAIEAAGLYEAPTLVAGGDRFTAEALATCPAILRRFSLPATVFSPLLHRPATSKAPTAMPSSAVSASAGWESSTKSTIGCANKRSRSRRCSAGIRTTSIA